MLILKPLVLAVLPLLASSVLAAPEAAPDPDIYIDDNVEGSKTGDTFYAVIPGTCAHFRDLSLLESEEALEPGEKWPVKNMKKVLKNAIPSKHLRQWVLKSCRVWFNDIVDKPEQKIKPDAVAKKIAGLERWLFKHRNTILNELAKFEAKQDALGELAGIVGEMTSGPDGAGSVGWGEEQAAQGGSSGAASDLSKDEESGSHEDGKGSRAKLPPSRNMTEAA